MLRASSFFRATHPEWVVGPGGQRLATGSAQTLPADIAAGWASRLGLLCLLSLLGYGQAWAQAYKCRTGDGQIIISASPCAANTREESRVAPETITEAQRQAARQAHQERLRALEAMHATRQKELQQTAPVSAATPASSAEAPASLPPGTPVLPPPQLQTPAPASAAALPGSAAAPAPVRADTPASDQGSVSTGSDVANAPGSAAVPTSSGLVSGTAPVTARPAAASAALPRPAPALTPRMAPAPNPGDFAMPIDAP